MTEMTTMNNTRDVTGSENTMLREKGARRLTIADYEARIHLYKEQIGIGYIGIGRTLNEAKEAGAVPAGQWEAWVTDVTGLTIRQAQRCMQAAREIRDGSALARLEMSKAMRLLSSGLDEDQREELAQRADEEKLTVKALEDEIRKLRQGHDQAVEQAKAWEERAKEAFSEGQKAAERAQTVEQNLQLVQVEEKARKKISMLDEARQAAIDQAQLLRQEKNELALQQDALRQRAHELELRAKQAEEQLRKRQGADQEQYRIGMAAGEEIGKKHAQQEADRLRQRINDQERLLLDRTKELQQLKLEKRQQQMAEARGAGLRPEAPDQARRWIPVGERLPETDAPVLAVKELKSGQRDICIARCMPDFEYYDAESGEKRHKPYWVCGGNNNILYWMTLPEMPEK